MDSSAPTILPPRVRVPSTPSMLLSFIVFGLYLSCEKGENKLKEVGFGPLFKKRSNQNADEIASEILLKNGAKFLSFQRKKEVTLLNE